MGQAGRGEARPLESRNDRCYTGVKPDPSHQLVRHPEAQWTAKSAGPQCFLGATGWWSSAGPRLHSFHLDRSEAPRLLHRRDLPAGTKRASGRSCELLRRLLAAAAHQHARVLVAHHRRDHRALRAAQRSAGRRHEPETWHADRGNAVRGVTAPSSHHRRLTSASRTFTASSWMVNGFPRITAFAAATPWRSMTSPV